MNLKHTIQTFAVILLCGLISLSSVSAQEQLSLREKAMELYHAYEYKRASDLYLKLVDTKSPRLKDMETLADCFTRINQYEDAETWYARIVAHPESSTENLLTYGRILKSNARYNEAKKVLNEYISKGGKQGNPSMEIAGCDSALVWIAKPTAHKIRNEAGVNTALSEFSVFKLYTNKIYYAAEPPSNLGVSVDGRTGNSFLRVYSANIDNDNALSDPLREGEIYNKERFHVGPVIANKAFDKLFVTRTYPGKSGEIERASKRVYRTNKLELYIYTPGTNEKWDAVPFEYNNVQHYSVGHAALSPDEQTLYFVSDMPGGQGGTDIWFCELQPEGKWGTPQNAGTAINTPSDEMFPTISPDGTLYFSSDGLPGMGGLDIFSAQGSKKSWTKPVNMRYPVNSPGDDFAFVLNSTAENNLMGFLSSNRKGGKGGDDIYSFSYAKEKPKLILALRGTVYNKKTNEVIDLANVTLFNGSRQIVAKQSSKGDGTFFFELDKDTDYSVLGQKEKFYSDSASLTTKGLIKSDTLVANLYLNPLFEVGKVIALKNIHYDFDKDNIRPDAAKILDELVRIMRDNPTLEIELGSHTDSRGPDIYNLDLSQRRARSAVNYLVSRGVARTRMIAKGFGETQLLNRCSNGVKCSVAEHQENRRTEFKILKY